MRNNSKRCNAQNAFFIGIKEWTIALVDISWLKANPANIFTDGDWMLSPSRITSLERSDLVVLGTAKLRYKKGISWPTTRRKRCIRKNFKRNSRSLSERFKISWCATQCWSNWGEVHRDGRAGTERFHLSPINWGKTSTSHWTNRARMHQSNSDQTSERQSQ